MSEAGDCFEDEVDPFVRWPFTTLSSVSDFNFSYVRNRRPKEGDGYVEAYVRFPFIWIKLHAVSPTGFDAPIEHLLVQAGLEPALW